MDPTNNNPTITPASSPEPQLGGTDQSNPVASPTSGPTLEPLAIQPSAQSPLAATDQAQPAMTSRIQTPASNPTASGVPQAAPSPASIASVPPVAPAGPTIAAPVNPIINPGVSSAQNGVGATDAILRPDPIPEPDPVEEELKAPMRAAAPVPGSIGSAVSGPTGDLASSDGQTPSVSFNDPATQPIASSSDQLQQSGAPKKTDRKTLIALIIVAAMVVIVLGFVLVMQFITPSPSSPSTSGTTNNSNTANNTISEPEQKNIDNGNTSSAVISKMSCTRAMTSAELEDFEDAASGNVNVSAKFSDDKLSSITLVKMVTYNNEDAVDNEPVEEVLENASSDDISVATAPTYYLSVSDDGTIDLTKTGIQKNYELLDFTCEVL